MESVNGALRSSLTLPEMEQRGVWDDICCKPAVDDFVSQNSTVSAEDFFVDDLLDFSKAEAEEEYDVCETKDIVNRDKIEDETFHLSPLNDENLNNHMAAVHETELCVPTDDLTDLEWLSNITDDSAPGYSLTMPAAKFPVKTAGKVSDTEVNGTEKCSVTKARSRRAKNGVRVWPHSESSTSSSSSSYASSSSPLRTWIMYKDVGHSDESFIAKPPAKKQKNRQEVDTTATGGALVPPRRCSHCLVQKTPQWRAGPMGAKTLCNACGVRYKSGRLLPEYRPACSPTFSIEKHSNNHRKVMEMRRKKEGDGGFATPVESF